MKNKIIQLIEKLEREQSLTLSEYEQLIRAQTEETAQLLAQKAVVKRQAVYGKDVYVRGLIEISNICKNDCYYCGIRRSNRGCSRYRLTKEEILETCQTGYDLGFRTFVLQGGEDDYYNDDVLCALLREIKGRYPDCAITLSLGERSYQSYAALRAAGADRYLLRHETADKKHYQALHPAPLSFERRMECLHHLKQLGYQVGCGFMVGSPYQTPSTLAKDLKFIEEFKPAMCGIGPYITHAATPFADKPSGDVKQTLYLLSIVRLIDPGLLLPATTALGTICKGGREAGILAGANVVMPNLSPKAVRKKYELYENKIATDEEAAEGKEKLDRKLKAIGYRMVTARGDKKEYTATTNVQERNKENE